MPPEDEALYIYSARGYALAAGAAAGDASLVKCYSDKAVDCIRKARERGWADIMTLEHDTDLEPIRNDPAFKALLDEFKRPGEKKGS